MEAIFTLLVLAAIALIGLYWAMKEDARRGRDKVKKMNIPKHIEESLDEIERKIS